MMTKSSRFAQQ